MKRISVIFAALALAASCDKPFEMDLPLSVAQRNISLTKDAGSTHLLVYSDGEWTASFSEPVEWASLNKVSGYGNSDLVFTYSANYGIARRVGIVLSKGELRDTVLMTQAGPVTLASYKLSDSSVELPQTPGVVSVGVSSNLYYSTDALTVTAIYTGIDGAKDTVLVGSTPAEDDHWIIAADPQYDRFEFEVDYNLWGKNREVDLVIGINDPTGRPLRSILKVTQSTAKPVFTLSSVSGTYDAAAQTVVVPAAKNNIWPYTSNTFIESNSEWVKNAVLTSEGLKFTLEENLTGIPRSARLTVNFISDMGDSIKASFSIRQNA